MMTKIEEIQNKYRTIQKNANADGMALEQLAAKISGLHNYLRRYMEPKRFEYASKWLHEIAEAIYYDNATQYCDAELFQMIYGIDYTDLMFEGFGPNLCDLKDIQQHYRRSLNTFGEVLLSIEPEATTKERTAQRDSIEEQIHENLKMIQKLNGYEIQ